MRSATVLVVVGMIGCSGAVEATSEPCASAVDAAAPTAEGDASVDAGAEADAPIDPCLETDRAIAACARGGASYGWAVDAECTGTPKRHTQLRTIERGDGRACCETTVGGVLCCPETCPQ